MVNNDILIRLRYALNITDLKLVELFELAGMPLSAEALRLLFLKEGEEGYRECDGPTLGAFLEGLVISRRGRKEGAPSAGPVGAANSAAPGAAPAGAANSAAKSAAAKPAWARQPSNNDVLKAVRIALQLREEDIVAILRSVNVDASKSEINALFRRKDQDNFRQCGDQFLRNFLAGVTKKYRV
jgi:uncharacterized protein YehS (DUF1456 family)